jgi:ATP-dependent helicase/nuclease subunit A
MSDKKINWTDQQITAIRRRGSDVLVTASAGTGKTAVLSGRCADIASDIAAGSSVWQMLVLTFTDAAAEQMENRIRQQLQAKLAEEPKNSAIQMQIVLLAGADIGTIHSFCRKIILEHIYRLLNEGIDPSFRVLDEDEQQLIKYGALEKTLAWAWEQGNLQAGLVRLFYRRDVKTESLFASKIIETSEFLECIPSRENWYQKAMELADILEPVDGLLGQKQKDFIFNRIESVKKEVQSAQRLYKSKSPKGLWSDKWNDFLEILNGCIKLYKAGKWDGVAAIIDQFEKPRTDRPKDVEDAIGDYLKGKIKEAVDDFEGLKELAILNPEYLNKISRTVSIETKVFIELVKRFDYFYSQAKRTLNGLDFADLEHYALKILSEDAGSGKIVPSQIARRLQQKYKYIFVDEYQDINHVQEAILKLISTPDNVFVVGDVKQSIYAFRGAEPKIFLKKLEPASNNPKDQKKPLRVDLNINFRSEKGILDFVNTIFANIMTSSLGGVDYDDSARLKTEEQKENGNTKTVVELHIIDKESGAGEDEQEQHFEEGQDSLTSRQCEAALIAGRIKQMVGRDTGKAEFQIFDTKLKSYRDVRFGDIVVLLRSPSKRINDYVKILRLSGIPVSSSGAEGYFEATEITDMLSVLKLLDNPQRDIELASILRSPLFNFSDSDLARIKIAARKNDQCKNFYDSVSHYIQSGEDKKLSGKLQKAFELIESWRREARAGKLSDLIWQIYRQTGYLSYVCALPSGNQRRANLLKLHDRAIQFENFVSSGKVFSLARFVEFIEKLQERGADWSFAEPENVSEDAVRITSIHKSKGLEFPVCFLAELNSKFNIKDSYEDVIADADLALGLKIVDENTNMKIASLAHQVISEEKIVTNLAEEMRVLYVAMTRARERLVLVGSEKAASCGQILLEGNLAEKPFDLWQVRRNKSFLGWILLGLSGQKKLLKAFGVKINNEQADEDLFELRMYNQKDIDEFNEKINRLRTFKNTASGKPDKQTMSRFSKSVEKIKNDLSWKYKYRGASLLPAKRTVSELSYENDEFKKYDYSKAFERKPKAALASVLQTADARLIGAAAHLLISNLDLAKPINAESLEQTRQNLIARQMISPQLARELELSSVLAFFESELGRLVLDKTNIVWREWPFTFTIPANQLNILEGTETKMTAAGETIIVQGIIDMLIKADSGLILIDFKTDNISASQAAGRAENYRRQLELYAQAAFSVLKVPVASKWLYFLKPQKAVQIA